MDTKYMRLLIKKYDIINRTNNYFIEYIMKCKEKSDDIFNKQVINVDIQSLCPELRKISIDYYHDGTEKIISRLEIFYEDDHFARYTVDYSLENGYVIDECLKVYKNSDER